VSFNEAEGRSPALAGPATPAWLTVRQQSGERRIGPSAWGCEAPGPNSRPSAACSGLAAARTAERDEGPACCTSAGEVAPTGRPVCAGGRGTIRGFGQRRQPQSSAAGDEEAPLWIRPERGSVVQRRNGPGTQRGLARALARQGERAVHERPSLGSRKEALTGRELNHVATASRYLHARPTDSSARYLGV
jgi:hypothetical protein